MDFTKQEVEVISWFIGKNWNEFSQELEGVIGINALHRLAQKLNLDKNDNSDKKNPDK